MTQTKTKRTNKAKADQAQDSVKEQLNQGAAHTVPALHAFYGLSAGCNYLVIADETREAHNALHYAIGLANMNKGHVSIAHIQDLNDFMHWGAVENIVRQDLRAQSENTLWEAASLCQEHGQIPSLYSVEGKKTDAIMSILKKDNRIKALVLGSRKKGNNPLITYFTNKGLNQIDVPVIIVPEADEGITEAKEQAEE